MGGGGGGAVYEQLSMLVLGPWATSFLTASSGPQESTKQNRRRMGQRFLNSYNEKSGVRLVHLGESSWPSTHPFSRAGVHHWIPLNKPGCLDETMRGTQSCTSRLGYKEALTCSLPNKYY